MKYAVAAVALAAISSAQSLSDIPQCAIPCIDNARTSSTNCAADDYACISNSDIGRNKDALTAAATGCVLTSCGAEVATSQVLPAVNAFCNAVESGSGGSSASSSAIASVTSTVTSVNASPTSTSAADTSTSSIEQKTRTSTASVSESTSGSVVTSNSTTSSTHGSSPTNSNPPTVPTAGAASVVGSLAVLALGLVAAL
ncbi:hypothetical protein K449DRAFT_427227 [Hypoxylon sp. EC38]|nr:hypothetical protein K449DRAFT_427227 [Hypoxylon sp. EC38]